VVFAGAFELAGEVLAAAQRITPRPWWASMTDSAVPQPPAPSTTTGGAETGVTRSSEGRPPPGAAVLAKTQTRVASGRGGA
jgi:hypothetical protein